MKTPQQSYPELASAIGVPELYFKREDLHPYGSHKGRSIPQMIKTYAKEGRASFVISSSGNAALAAIHTTEQHNKNNPNKEITLTILVGNHVDPNKLKLLKAKSYQPARPAGGLTAIRIEQVANPKQAAFQLDKAGTAKLLRQSTDDLALEGYGQLADELLKIQNLEAVFIPTSSGTTAQALGEAFSRKGQKIQIHIVQTTACHPIATVFEPLPNPPLVGEGRVGLAGAIVDHIAHRREKVINVIKQTSGYGWIVTDEEIRDAIKITKEKTRLDISPNSALSVAGLIKAVEAGWKWNGAVVCLITGQ